MAEIHLTERALNDLQEIHIYSTSNWGIIGADKYLNDIQEALHLLEINPNILKTKILISKRFKTYQVRKHYLIFDVVDDFLFLLAIRHVSMNTLGNIRDLEPSLENECNALYKALKNTTF